MILHLLSPPILDEPTQFYEFIANLLYGLLKFASFHMPGEKSLTQPLLLKHLSFFGRWPWLEESRKQNNYASSHSDDSSHTFLCAKHFMYYIPTYYILYHMTENTAYFVILFFFIGKWGLCRLSNLPKAIHLASHRVSDWYQSPCFEPVPACPDVCAQNSSGWLMWLVLLG